MSVLFLCLALLADQPRALISAPATAAPGDLVILDATASNGDVFIWESLDGIPCLPVDGGHRCVFASGRPGAYRFLLATAGIVGAKAVVATARVTVRIEAPAPPPPPTPAPTPPAPIPTPTPTPPSPPGPAPVQGKLYATLVFSEPALTPTAASLRADATLGPALAALGCQWAECESSSAEFRARNLAPHTSGRALPLVIVQGSPTSTLAPGVNLTLPVAPVVMVFEAQSAADVITRIKGLRGR